MPQHKTATLTLEQQQTVDAANPAYRFDLDVGFVAALPAAPARDAGDGPLPRAKRGSGCTSSASDESFAISLEAEPKLVRVDPGAYVLGAMTYAFDADVNAAILAAEPSAVARIRAAKALGKDGARAAREALAQSLARDPFWAVAAEVAIVLGELRSPAGRDALLANRQHPHPKVRRAVAEALGNYRDAGVASALLELSRRRVVLRRCRGVRGAG